MCINDDNYINLVMDSPNVCRLPRIFLPDRAIEGHLECKIANIVLSICKVRIYPRPLLDGSAHETLRRPLALTHSVDDKRFPWPTEGDKVLLDDKVNLIELKLT